MQEMIELAELQFVPEYLVDFAIIVLSGMDYDMLNMLGGVQTRHDTREADNFGTGADYGE
jgi:hypothetical protein